MTFVGGSRRPAVGGPKGALRFNLIKAAGGRAGVTGLGATMTADDPGAFRGTHWAHEGEKAQPEVTRVDVTEVVEVTSEGVAELDVTEPARTVAAPPPNMQPPYASQPYPQQYQQPQAQPQQYPQPLPYPGPQPYAGPQPYPQQFAQPQGQPTQPYPQQFAQPQAAYAYPPTAYPHQPSYGWGTQVPPPPRPKISLPRRTLAIASALVIGAVLTLAVGLAIAQPSGGSAAKRTTGTAAQDEAARAVWRTATVNQLLPASIKREGSETYIRLGINPDESCAKLPGQFVSGLVPTECAHVLSATYTDRTQTVTATVGIVVVSGSVDQRLRLAQSWTADSKAANQAMMPHAYPVPHTVAANFTDTQRVTWQSQASSDGTYVVYAVAGFTDGRTGPGAAAMASGTGSALSSSSPAVQVAADLPGAILDLLSTQIQDSQGGGS